MSSSTTRLKYYTGRDNQVAEFPKVNTTILTPDGGEFTIRWDHINQGIEITKVYGSDENDSAMHITPRVSNQILIK